MELSRLNPFIRYAKLHLNYCRPKENNVCYDCRLFYILRGDGMLYANGQSYNISQNFVVFLPPGTRYRFEFTSFNEARIYVLNFDLTDDHSDVLHSLGTDVECDFDPSKLITSPFSEEFNDVIVNEELHLQNYIASCVNLFLSKTIYYRHYASAQLKLALIELLNEYNRKKDDYILIQDIQEYIRRNYQNPKLNNKAVATEFSYHPYYLGRLMKQHTQKTMHEYIVDYRLHMAKTYLVTTKLNVTEIAGSTGFASYTHFIKIFREKVGISPLQYRKSHQMNGY